jgi:hypothetical protein
MWIVVDLAAVIERKHKRKKDRSTGPFHLIFQLPARLAPKRPQLALSVSGRVVQRDQFPRRVVLCSKRIRGVRVDYRQDISAADSTENEVLLVNGDNSVSFVEYRIVVHEVLDAPTFGMDRHPASNFSI